MILAANDRGEKEFYLNGESQAYSNISSVYEAQQAKEETLNKPISILTDDQGWYQRLQDKVNREDADAASLRDYDCYALIEVMALTLGLSWIATGFMGVCGSKNESFPTAFLVPLLSLSHCRASSSALPRW